MTRQERAAALVAEVDELVGPHLRSLYLDAKHAEIEIAQSWLVLPVRRWDDPGVHPTFYGYDRLCSSDPGSAVEAYARLLAILRADHPGVFEEVR